MNLVEEDSGCVVSDVIDGDITEEVLTRLAEHILECPEFEDELVGNVKVHNLLCRYFAVKRRELGIPEPAGGPQPVDLLIVRESSPRGDSVGTSRL